MIKKTFLLIAAAGFLIASPASYAASFDCAKARNWIEKTICSDVELSGLDEQLTDSYQNALAVAAKGEALKAEQKAWLKSTRNPCKDIACLRQAYVNRIAGLDGVVAAAPKANGIFGEYERYDNGKPAKDSATILVKEEKDGRIHVRGDAAWVGNAERGNVNTGELEGSFPLDNGKIHYADGEAEGCRLTIAFAPNGLTVSDDNMRCGGLNVSFNGQYRKVKGKP
ncbi:lysozyme inhibitor LprI family protein [Methylomicrobium lacus]|uniref:lysozyme inhibitor LprI family protein n=1 Tax=Methylomicrobium lacus TaxID=136992 RepID=UPI0035A886F7